jgi:pimeloyl-ACP methyl ester carboxylesterase
MREKVVRFGRSTRLVGVLTEPDVTSPDRPAVILLNSGILHRVGACRLHVNLARALADAGLTAIRFDYSGIGDSEARKDDLSFEQSAVVETREAMDYLRDTKGVSHFVLAGLCSGADMAHMVAKVDDRVVGLGLLDAWCYRTPKFYLHHYGRRVLRLSSWTNFIAARLRRLREPPQSAPAAGEDGEVTFEMPRYVREFPPREQTAADLRDFMARNVEMFLVFTGGQEEQYNYRRQYEDSFRGINFQNRVRVEFLKEADHIFTGLPHQQQVIRDTVEWVLSRWPVRDATPAEAGHAGVPRNVVATAAAG